MADEQKQAALVPTVGTSLTATPKAPDYWGKVAGIYSLLFRLLLIALPLYVVVFMAICSRAFTYESIFCFFKDLRATTSFVTSDYQNVLYTYEEGESLVLPYRGGVAAVSEGGVEIFSPDGERLLNEEIKRTVPRAAASRKYLISYDFGKTSFTVTNTYAKLHEGETEFPIYMVEVADTGHFAFVTSAREHLSQVVLYDGNFRLIQRFQKASAITGVALSENGKYIALLGLSSEGGTEHTRLELYRIGEETPSVVRILEGEAPLALDFTDNRHLALLSDRSLRVFDLDGDCKSETALAGEPHSFVCNENGTVLILEQDALRAEHRVICLDARGRVGHDDIYTGEVRDLSLAKERVFLLGMDCITAISCKDGSVLTQDIDKGATGLFAIDDKRIRLIYPGEARLLIME